MGNVYRRGKVLWIWWFDSQGVRQYESTGYPVGQERKARAALRKMEERAKAGVATDDESVAGFYFGVWRPFRRARDLSGQANEEVCIEKHVLPYLGSMRLEDVRHHDVLNVVYRLEKAGRAPRTIHNVVGAVRRLFKEARRRGLVDANPCMDLQRGDLPVKRDKDPEWREGAVFERHEIEHLCFSPSIPLWRRIDYALAFFTGTRDGERFALRWRHWDASAQPLGKLTFARSWNAHLLRETETKTKVPRYVPVHPALAGMLTEWRDSGWEEYMGRAPGPEDLVIPYRRAYVKRRHVGSAERRNPPLTHKYLQIDLEAQGWRNRRAHDFRSTMINLALEDGAQEGIVRRLTHLKASEAFDLYKRNRWPVLCAEVAKIRVGSFAAPDAVTTAVTPPLEREGRVAGHSADNQRRPALPALDAAREADRQRLARTAGVTDVTPSEWERLDRIYFSLLQQEGEA